MEMNLHFTLAYHVLKQTSFFLYFKKQTVAVHAEIFHWNVFAYLTDTSCEKQEVTANERYASRDDTDMPRRRYDSSREVPLATLREREKR